MFHWLVALIVRLCSNWIGLLSCVLTTLAGVGILLLALTEALSVAVNDYASLFGLIALTVVFLVGAALIPFGLARAPAHKDTSPDAAHHAGHSHATAQRVVLVAGATIMTLATAAVGGEGAMKKMNSPLFCGTACHAPMQPMWEAYQVSPHAGVECVSCHVGSGFVSGVRAKLDGSKRLMAMLTDDYTRPIPTPVAGTRPAEAICEKCHSRDAAKADKVKVYPHYGDDRANKPAFSVALLHLGPRSSTPGEKDGTHSHGDGHVEIRYVPLDKQRHHIGEIRVLEDGKLVAQYRRPNDAPTAGEERKMDCLDCHNQPSHRFAVSARQAVDEALYAGTLNATVPYVSIVAVELLTAGNPDREHALGHFQQAVKQLYATRFPDEKMSDEQIEGTAKGLTTLYRRNIYPDMKVAWGTYRSHTDHRDAKDEVGCFRCHNSDYEATFLAEGRRKKLDQNCETCHTMLASDEDPAEMEEAIQPLMHALK